MPNRYIMHILFELSQKKAAKTGPIIAAYIPDNITIL